jgi:hypothetical protein
MEGNALAAHMSFPNFILDFVPGSSGPNGDVIRSRQRSTLTLIAAFWVFTFTVMSVQASVSETLTFDVLGPRRVVTSAFGTLLCVIMVRLLGHLRTSSFPRWIAWGMIGAFAMAVSLTAFSMTMNRILMPLPGTSPPELPELVQRVLIYFGYCLAWTGTHLALTYHWQVEDERQRAAALTELAQGAQIAALRYQINPHFLFNSLNSISALVMERRNDDAETMLLNLCTFVRTTFAKDPRALIPLSEEIALQRLYLGIEETRFSERMKVLYEVPDDLAGARVPTLILQPLVENALRHGVGESEKMTTVRICAARRGDQLHLVVEDDSAGARGAGGSAPDGSKPASGGLGLHNVRDRLHAHFGEDASFEAKRREAGGFRVDISLPLQGAA